MNGTGQVCLARINQLLIISAGAVILPVMIVVQLQIIPGASGIGSPPYYESFFSSACALLVALLGPHGDHAFSLRLIENAKPLVLAVMGQQAQSTGDLDIMLTFEMAGIVGVYAKWCMDGKSSRLVTLSQNFRRSWRPEYRHIFYEDSSIQKTRIGKFLIIL